MPSYEFSVPHSLTREQAVEKLQHFTDRLKEKMGDQVSDLEQTWEGDRTTFGFTTFGFRITGSVDVQDDAVHVEGELPFAAAMFKGKIVSEFKEQLDKVLSR